MEANNLVKAWTFLGALVATIFHLSLLGAQVIVDEPQADRLPLAQLKTGVVAQQNSELMAVRMQSGTFVPIGSVSNNLHAIRAASKSGKDSDRVLLQFDTIPGPKELKVLEDAGIRLAGYLPERAYFANLPKNTKAESLRLAGVVWVGRVYAVDRLSERLRTGAVGAWATHPDGSYDLIAKPYPEYSMDAASNAVVSVGGTVLRSQPTTHSLRINIPADALSRLLDSPVIRWLEEIQPPAKPNNNGSRGNTQVGLVQESPYSLTGAGVVVGVWDEGPIDGAHPDLVGRVEVVQAAEPVSSHATHVAGTLAGAGNNSALHGGFDGQWKGAAPASKIISYDFNGDTVSEHGSAISTYGVSISHNSWGFIVSSQMGNCAHYGDYGSIIADYDALIEGGLFGVPVTVVFSAGNERDDGDCGMTGSPVQNLYYSNISSPGSSKNALCVGAINSDNNSITSFSSWGPVDDGRIKPEIVAPGSQTGVDSGITSTLPGGGYGSYSGTSMAAPAVSGALALLTQDYKAHHGGLTPRPSTLRALVVHTAEDLDDASVYFNKGPDYASGYGRLQIKAAVDQLRAGGLVEGSVGNNSTNFTQLEVGEGTPAVKVTLVWDDVPGQENASTALVNDLDLIVIDPAGNRHYPWTLNPNNPSADAVRNAEDHLNVIEQVVVDSGVLSGTWKIQVRGKTVTTSSQRYALVASPAATPPFISAISSQKGLPSTPLVVPFIIGDQSTPASSLVVSASSSNQELIPDNAIVFGGAGSNRVVTLAPVAGAVGFAQIILSVSDGGLTSSCRFTVDISNERQFANAAPLILFDGWTASVYPSVISVPPGTYGLLASAEVDLLGLSHEYPRDIRALLVGPGGGKILLLSRVGGNSTNAVVNADITLSDSGSIFAPAFGQLLGGITYKPSSDHPSDLNESFPFPAPPAPYSSHLSDALSPSPVGDWKLFIVDNALEDIGSLGGGWRLRLKFVNAPPVLGPVSNISILEDQVPLPFTVAVSDIETASSNLVLSGRSSNVSLIPNEGIVISGTGLTRTVLLKPLPEASGNATITLTLSDGALTVTNHFQLTVAPVNDAPTISSMVRQNTTFNQAVGPVDFTVGDIDSPVASLVLTATSSNPLLLPVSNITFGGFGANRTFTLAPVPGMSGTSTVTINVSDGTSNAFSSFILTVGPPGNTPPHIQNIVDRVIREDEMAGPIAIIVSDAESPAESLIVSGASSNPNLVPSSNIHFGGSGSTRTVTLTPLANAFGTTTITVSVSDGVFTVSDEFQLSVLPVNDAPTMGYLFTITASGTLPRPPIHVYIADIDSPVTELQITATSSNPGLLPVSGIVFEGVGGERTFTLTPRDGVTGSSTVTFTVSDGSASSSRSFLYTFTYGNRPPLMSHIVDREIYENEVAGPIGFSVEDPDTPLDSLNMFIDSTNPELLPVSNIVLSGSGSFRTLTATPLPNKSGATFISVVVHDGGYLIGYASEVFLLTVLPRNSPPTIGDIVDYTISEDQVLGPISLSIDDIDSPIESLSLTVTSSNPDLLPVSNITIEGSGSGRTLTGIPVADRNGTSLITVTVSDGALSSSDSFLLTVNPVNDAPQMEGLGNVIGRRGTPLAVSFKVRDVDSPVNQVTLQARSLAPSIVDSAGLAFIGEGTNRLMLITPFPDGVGLAKIQVVASDGFASSTNEFTVNVMLPSLPPVISNIPDQTVSEDTSSALISFLISDAETVADNLKIVAQSSNQLLIPDSNISLGGTGTNRTIAIFPASQASGLSVITVTVTDDSGSISSDTFVVTVLAVNDSPTITMPDDASLPEDSSLFISFSVGDVETSSSSLVVSATSGNTTVVPNSGVLLGGNGGDRTLRLVPSANASGVVPIEVKVDDGETVTLHTLTVTVHPVNDAPLIPFLPDVLMVEDVPYVIPFSISDVETPVNNLIVKAYTSNPSLIPDNPLNLVLGGSGSDRTLTLVPATNSNSGLVGQSTIYIEVTDGNGVTTSRSFLATVLAVNDAPQIINTTGNLVLNEDSNGQVSFSVSDAETASSSLTVNATSGNTALLSNSGLTLSGTGSLRTVSIVPTANQSGSAVVTLSVSDGVNTTRSSFTVTVNEINDLPAFTLLSSQTILEDGQTATQQFHVRDVETSADFLQVTAESSNQLLFPNANLILGGSGSNRTFFAKPLADQFGQATIVISISDGIGISTFPVLLVVLPVLDVPTISSIPNQTTTEDTPITVHFSVGDAETPAGSLILQRFTSNYELVPPSGANLILGGSGSNRTLTIIPAPNANSLQSGVSVISIVVTDSDGLTATTSFQLTVAAVNDPPTISALPDISLLEDGSSGLLPLAIGDAETSVAQLTLSATSSNPDLVPPSSIVFDGAGSSRTVSFAPLANKSGTATLTLKVEDLGGAFATSSFRVEVIAVNDAPLISAILPMTIVEDGTTGTVPFTTSDAETPAASLTVSASSSNTSLVQPGNIVLGGSGTNRTIVVNPLPNRFGTSTITVTSSDGKASTSSSFLLTVLRVDHEPTISSISSQSLLEDELSLPISFTVSDAETQPEALVVSATSSNPNLLPLNRIFLSGVGAQRYVTLWPAANANSSTFGSANVTITVSDGTSSKATTFSVAVTAVNDAPVIQPVANRVIKEDEVAGPFLISINDVETPVQNLVVTASSSNPSLVPNSAIKVVGLDANRTVTITPLPDQFGTTTISMTVSDGNASSSASFLLTVNPVNDRPTISVLPSLSTPEDTPITVSFTVKDKELPADFLILSRSSSNVGLVPNSAANLVLGGSGENRTLTIIPATNANSTASGGTTTIELVASDGNLAAVVSFELTVTPVNDSPTVIGPGSQRGIEDTLLGPIAFTVGDIESSSSSLNVVATSSDQELLPNDRITFSGSGATRFVSLLPATNRFGVVTVTLSASDGSLTGASTFQTTFSAVNDPPALSHAGDRVTSMNTPIVIPFTVSDPETAASALSVSRFTSNTGLIPHNVDNMILSGTGTNRSLTLIPATDQTGSSLITIIVSDGELIAQDQFTVTIGAGAPSLARSSATRRALDRASQPLPSPWLQNPIQFEGKWGVQVYGLKGLYYRLEFKDALKSENWSILPGVPGKDEILFVSDPNPSTNQRFYRLKVE